MVLFATTLQSTIFKFFPLNYFQPDFVLIMTVYLGFKRESIEGGLLVILSSFILEAHSGAGKSFLLTAYTYSFVITKLMSKVIVVPNRITLVMISAGLSLFTKMINLFLLGMDGKAGNAVANTFIYLVPSMLTQAAAAVILLGVFNLIDLKTFKDAHAEDEYDINREF
jgi:hypothetical protein